MTPEQQAIIKALMSSGPVSRGGAYFSDTGALGNNTMGRPQTGPKAAEPWKARMNSLQSHIADPSDLNSMEELEKLQAERQKLYEKHRPQGFQPTQPGQEWGPDGLDQFRDRTALSAAVEANGQNDLGTTFESMLADMPPEVQQVVIDRLKQGMSPQEAFAPQGFTTRR